MTRIHVPISLRWSDLDAYGHVNNAEMLRLLEEARIRVFWADVAVDGAGDNAVSDATSRDAASRDAAGESHEAAATAVIYGGPGADTVTLIAGQQIEYLAPVPFLRKPLDVQLWIGRMGGASLEICYEVRSPLGTGEQTVYAKASTTLVLVDAKTERPRRLTDQERAAWEPHVDDPIQFRRS